MYNKLDNLQKSYELSSQQIDDAVNPLEVAALFEKESLCYVLIGGHMLSHYTGSARATVDVDFIIENKDLSDALRIIDETYTQFKQHDRVYHITYDSLKPNSKDAERIDLVKGDFPLFKEVVRNYSIEIQSANYQIRIPIIEAAVALKFAASVSPNRVDENKAIDNADLLKLVRSQENLNNEKLKVLGDLVYQSGGKELISVVEDIKNGIPVNL